MSSTENLEAQAEELEVLGSIYEGDSQFKVISNTSFQYILGNDASEITVLIEISWPTDYPASSPHFNLGAFYNNHLNTNAKDAFMKALNQEAEQNVGMPQTFTIIEWAKDHFEEILRPYVATEEKLPSRLESLAVEDETEQNGPKTKPKKEQLTKAQKRKEWDRVDNKGEKPRGHDWVDVIKHLSQTGSKGDSANFSSSQQSEPYLCTSSLPPST